MGHEPVQTLYGKCSPIFIEEPFSYGVPDTRRSGVSEKGETLLK